MCSSPAITPFCVLLFTGCLERVLRTRALSQVGLRENHVFVMYLLCEPDQATWPL